MSKKHEEQIDETPKQEETKEPTLEEALTAENEKLIAEVERLTAENEKLNKTCQRLQSSADKSDTYLNQLVAMKNDFESYKRRMKFSAESSKQEGISAVVARLIAVCDNFERAKQHLTEENAKAFEMVHNQFLEVLKEFGVEELDVLGKPFDCMTMSALSKVDKGEENKDIVVEVFKKGYKVGDKILRYAEVIVGA